VIENAIRDLNNELATLRKFVALLTSEQQFLLSNDIDNLLTMSEVKTQLANKLTEIANARRSSLFQNGINSMEMWIAKYTPGTLNAWSSIRDLAAQAQQLNNINGELINSKIRNNQQALGALYSATQNQNVAGLYGPDGQANISSTGRHLGSV
jgi:flagellar biosynthesis protein FlgN